MKHEGTARYADMFAALGAEPRLQIVRLLLSAHPEGMIVSDIQAELEIPNSTLSHHLEKLRMEGLVTARKDKQWLWYSANADALQDLLGFLYAECCTRSKVVDPVKVLPQAYKLQFENDWVKVTRVHYAPHEKLPPHQHTQSASAYVYLNDS